MVPHGEFVFLEKPRFMRPMINHDSPTLDNINRPLCVGRVRALSMMPLHHKTWFMCQFPLYIIVDYELALAGVVKSYEEGAHQLAAYGRVHSDFEACIQYANATT
jgi:hypothetical protein